MKRMVLVRYGEIILKGCNRPMFEDALIRNIRTAVSECGEVKITKAQATIYIEPLENDTQTDYICEKLKKVFGIVSIVVAYRTEKSIESAVEEIKTCFDKLLKSSKTFKVEAKRADKKFPLKSPEICAEVGEKILDAYPNLSVDVKEPDVVLHVEMREGYGYVHTGKEKGTGGMPSGTNGKAMLLLSGGIDSPVAGYMIGKRGVSLEAVHFFSYPYTSDRAKDKVMKLSKIIGSYMGGIKVHIVPFTEIQLQIRDKCPEEHLTLVMRRFMMQIAEIIAEKRNCTALVTGESIGQVASQTMSALKVTDDAVSMPVFRPLIGMDKEEIVEISRNIDTFETSILPYEDCCTVFTPKHPATKPRIEKVIASQSLLDCEALIKEAVEGTELAQYDVKSGEIKCTPEGLKIEDNKDIAYEVYSLLKEKGMTVATAESCTGGMIGQRLTNISGVSECYGYGVITYANEAKIKLLGVSEKTLETFGAVSEQTACEMACGARKMSGADIAVSVTGIAGPGGGSEQKPVGLVYIGIDTKDGKCTAYKNIFKGGRQSVREQTVNTALNIIKKYLEEI